MDCLFCKIINREIPSTMVYEDHEIVAFNDIHPKAKTHILIVPKKHIETIKDLNADEKDGVLMGKMILVAQHLGKEKSLEGYTLQFNVGRSAGQEIFHVHLHLLSNQ